MKSVCFFSSYFEGGRIPYYAKCYLQELVRHFTEMVLITNEKELLKDEKDFLSQYHISYMPVKNEGFDFGMWHKAFQKFDVSSYDRIGLINDSCILFAKLDHVFDTINKNSWDYCGLIDSKQIAHHIQSYFVIINKRAIPVVADYFRNNGIVSVFDEVIRTYEVQLPQHLTGKGFSMGSVYSYKTYTEEHNPSFFSIEQLIKSGFPMIKKKIIFGNYREGELRHLLHMKFNIFPNHYLKLIRKYNPDPLIDLSRLKEDYPYVKVNTRLFLHYIIFAPYYRAKNLARIIYRFIFVK